MTILNAQIEESQVSNGIDWNERLTEAYPEDTPLMQELSALRDNPKREFTDGEKTNFIKSYNACKHKPTVMRKYGITLKELNEALKNG